MTIEQNTNSLSSLPILDLSLADDPLRRKELLTQLHDALFNVGFLYIKNHGVDQTTIDGLVQSLPALFDQPIEAKAKLSKKNSPHFLGYSGFAEEVTLGQKDLREQFDFATELPVIWQNLSSTDLERTSLDSTGGRDFSKLYWRLRGPNQWPAEDLVPGFRDAYIKYHDAVQDCSYRFVHLVEEAFGIPVGTFDDFFRSKQKSNSDDSRFLPPQHRIKLVKYPPTIDGNEASSQGVGPHKDSSGWLTFLYQVGNEEGLEVQASDGHFIPAPPIEGTFVVNFGNAFEAATEGAVKATVHRVKGRGISANPRYSIPFFQGLPLDLTVPEIRSYIPESVRRLEATGSAANGTNGANTISNFLDPRWQNLGESQLRKWIRSHEDVARIWYGDEVTDYYLQ